MRGILIIFLVLTALSFSKEAGFTQEDRERLIKLETTLKVFMQQVDKRFEQIDKRFEQVNERFNDLINFLWIVTGIFTTIMVATFGFAWWDRRTIKRRFALI